MEKTKQFFQTVGWIVLAIAIAPVVAVMAVIAVAIESIIWNPCIFYLLMLVAPKKTAQNIAENAFDDDTIFFIKYPARFFWKINKSVRNLLPWRCKQELLLATNLQEATTEEEIRFFQNSDRAALLEKRILGRNALARLWPMYNNNILDLMLPYMGRLSFEEFVHLLDVQRFDLISKHMQLYTLSEKMLLSLFNNTDDRSLVLLCTHIRKNGLPATLINKFFKSDKKQEQIPMIVKAINEYNQVQLTKQTESNITLWEATVKSLKQDNLCVPAQVLMNHMQYKCYRQYGKHLSEEAIIYFLSIDDAEKARKAEMLKDIIKYELVGKTFSSQIMCLLKAKTNLMAYYLEA